MRIGRTIAQFWYEAVEPYNLGMCRALMSGALAVAVVGLMAHEGQPFGGSAAAGGAALFPSPFWSASPELIGVLRGFWLTALVLSAVGLFSRTSATAACFLGIYVFGYLPYQHWLEAVLRIGVLAMLVVLAASRCGDAWSVDRLIHVWRLGLSAEAFRPILHGRYMWPVQLLRALSMAMLGCALWACATGHTDGLLQGSADGSRSAAWSVLGVGLAGCAAVGWLTNHAAARGLLLAGGIGLIWTLFRGWPASVWCISLACWVSWDGVGLRLAHWLRTERRHAVLFDGGCGFCRRSVALMRRLDLLQRLDFYDVYNNWRGVEAAFGRLDQEACLEDMHLVTRAGRLVKGFQAYRAIFRVIPLTWAIAPLTYLPGISHLGSWLYRRVASNRCRDECRIPHGGDAAIDG